MTMEHLVSVIIPARNERAAVARIVEAVLAQRSDRFVVEILVVDDGSTDGTAEAAERAGAKVLRLPEIDGGNPARARNRGAAAASGDVLVFLDCDCIPKPGWLEGLIDHLDDHSAVGGSLGLPPGLPLTARLDYYCGWYHVHPGRNGGRVQQHPPGNLCVRREIFDGTVGFVDSQPIAYSHEELAWQAQCQAQGGSLYFAPRAVVEHYNRPGLANLLARNYRWGYGALPAKSAAPVVRLAWLYRFPLLILLLTPALPVVTTAYVIGCWLRAGVLEPLLLAPLVFTARCAYGAGMMMSCLHSLRATRRAEAFSGRPRWQ